jgi:hypothetical protein
MLVTMIKSWMVLVIVCAACGGSKKQTVAAPSPTPTQVQTDAATQDLRAKCCPECLQASGRDPSGVDITTNQCSTYTADDADCFAWFRSTKLTVGECSSNR